MKTSSAKAKGQRLAKQVKAMVLSAFPSLQDDDILVRSSSVPGEDLVLSPKARALLHMSIECKNTEKLNIWQAYAQCKTNAKEHVPALVFSRNRSEILVTIKLEWLLSLLKLAAEEQTPRGVRWVDCNNITLK